LASARGLDPETLAAQHASDHWRERLDALKGQILIGTAHRAEGQAQAAPAIAALKAERVEQVKLVCPGCGRIREVRADK
jgi:hypothetical protein